MLDTKFWERYFKVYDVLNLFIPYRELLEAICHELNIKPGEKILEAGCGTGNLALKIKERGANVVGIDNCEAALEIYKKKDPDAELVLADLTQKLPFPDNYFDKIACNNVLYTIPKNRQPRLLAEFYRILRPGGKIVLANPKKGFKVYKIYIAGIKENFRREGVAKSVLKILKLANFSIKILYYNRLIARESEFHFFDIDEQKRILAKAGFRNATDTELVYGRQCLLNSAIK